MAAVPTRQHIRRDTINHTQIHTTFSKKTDTQIAEKYIQEFPWQVATQDRRVRSPEATKTRGVLAGRPGSGGEVRCEL